MRAGLEGRLTTCHQWPASLTAVCPNTIVQTCSWGLAAIARHRPASSRLHAAALNQPGRPSTANPAIRIVRRAAGFRDYPPLLRNRSVTGTRRRRRRTEEHGGRDRRRAMPATSELDQVWHRADDSVDYTTAIGNDESDRVMLLSSRVGAPRSSNRLTRWARASSIAWISILASPCPGHTCMP